MILELAALALGVAALAGSGGDSGGSSGGGSSGGGSSGGGSSGGGSTSDGSSGGGTSSAGYDRADYPCVAQVIPAVRQAQQGLNAGLRQIGQPTIAEDGKAGPATCAAYAMLEPYGFSVPQLDDCCSGASVNA